ncbi:MAG: hypothetical protein ABI262_06060 [Microcoleus sp.]
MCGVVTNHPPASSSLSIQIPVNSATVSHDIPVHLAETRVPSLCADSSKIPSACHLQPDRQ